MYLEIERFWIRKSKIEADAEYIFIIIMMHCSPCDVLSQNIVYYHKQLVLNEIFFFFLLNMILSSSAFFCSL